MNITITGASGFIGRRLIETLTRDGHTVHALSRTAKPPAPSVTWSAWDVMKGEPPAEALERSDAVIHLAGEPVAQKWTPEAKQKIRDTRVAGTRRLVQALSTLAPRPATLVCASAIGIYGSRGDEILTEASAAGNDFLAEVCREWEQQADLAESLGIRVVKIRIGVVLGRGGGALEKMLPPFKAFVGGRLGSGKQWMSWIHLDDLTGLMRHAVGRPLKGVVNGTSPNPVTNAEFTRQLAATLRRPAIFPVPALALRALFGEMAEVLLASQRVLPQAAQSSGFQFAFPALAPALKDCLTGAA